MQEEEACYMYPSTSTDRQDFDFDADWEGIVKAVYKSDIITPTMVFSVIGDSNSFVPSPWPKAVFQTGLMEAARNGGDTWIIYRGKKHGLSKIIRDAYRDYGNMEFDINNKGKDIRDEERRVKLISITKTQTKDALAPEHSLCLMNEKEEPAVIVVSGEKIGENAQFQLDYSIQLPDVEKHMIAFERFVSKKEGIFFSQNKDFSIRVPVPVAIIVCEGDILTIAHVEGALEMKLPVIVVKGSGKAADLIVDYLENPESLKRKASLLFGIRFDDKNFKILKQYLTKIKEKEELLSFFDVHNDDPLMFSNIVGEAIVSSWAMEKIININALEGDLEAMGVYAKGTPQYNVTNTYSIGFTMINQDSITPQTVHMAQVLNKYKESRTHAMESTFSKPSSLPLYFYFGYQLLQESNLLQDCGHILILEALKSNRCDYVRVLLDQDVNLKMRDLPVLYEQTISCDCEENEELCVHIQWILEQIHEEFATTVFKEYRLMDKQMQSKNEETQTGKKTVKKVKTVKPVKPVVLGMSVASSARGLCRLLLKYDEDPKADRKKEDTTGSGEDKAQNVKGEKKKKIDENGDNTGSGENKGENSKGNKGTEIDENEDTDVSDILIWALLANRKELAEICWLRSEHHLLTGLISSAILKKLAKKANDIKEQILSRDLENHSILFQKRCLDLMDRMYEEKMDHAIKLMDDEPKVWGIDSSPLTFAYENVMYDIVAHTCSQKNMNKVWYNNLAPDTWPFICSIVQHPAKFLTAPLTKYIFNFVMFFSMLMIYSAFVLTSISTEYYDNFLAKFLEYYVYFWGAGDLIEEVISCFGGLELKSDRGLSSRIKRHFYNFWNIVDSISYLLLIAALVVRHFHPSTKFTVARRMFSLSLLAMYLRFLEAFLIHRHMGPTLIMIKEMLKDLLRFLVLVVFVVVGVGMYYHANLWPDHQRIWGGDWTEWRIWKIIYYPYWQLYGDAYNDFLEGKDLSDCSNVTSIWQNDPSIDRCPQEDWTVSAISAVYMLFSNLLLVNLVIAMFSYTFERVQENSEKLWRFQRYTVINDYRWRIPSPINLLLLPYRLYEIIKKCHGSCCSNKTGPLNDSEKAKFDYRVEFQKIIAFRIYNKM
ncbi:transient receptor potential cation channel subfamily M member 2-like [Ostrea edulis]|uniref:transient receptor potential cation channel subfamily M member 2-like n=1 Tax=Ostrea edulis TaxID=37623 RepID=UPI0024AE93D3|nr:transient receptor potential cation channel subfamily M member 2-like [Ostrea edulis]XP_056002344.1 transient receptor potential cation channel subfamily M member 2-like [Ostrea edulis]